MHKQFHLQPLADLAHHKNEDAAKKLGQLNQQKQSAQGKLDTLLQYRKDYHMRFQEAAKQGLNPNDLRNYQDFIHRLDEAIAQQRALVEKAIHHVQAGRDEFQQTQRKMKSFDTLAQRHHASERKREQKIEQRLQDEYTGRFAARKQKPEDNES